MQVLKDLKSGKSYSTDREQAVVRVINCCVVIVYAYACFLNQLLDFAVVGIYLFALPFSLVVLGWSIKKPDANVPRRVIGMLADLGTTTAAMSLSGEAGSPLFLIYLWTTFGNGFRYGKNYLYLSMCLSLFGFSLVAFLSSYWSEHMYLVGGMMLTLSVLPAYIAALLKRLQMATEEAQQASKAKSQFLATMSHEIRTPLNGVVGMSDMLVTTDMTREQQEYATIIRSSARTLLELIENILDFSKIEAGKTELENVDFQLRDLVDTVTGIVFPLAVNKGVACKVHLAADVPALLTGDSIHLRQVLINLLGNAVKFTEKGAIELNIYTLDTEDDMVRLRFEVVDTGIGMNRQEQDLIFMDFTQADQSISRRFGGSGLGTAISKKLIEFMGGRIGVVSAPGRGSKFWFELDYHWQPEESDTVVEDPIVSATASILLIGSASKRRQSLVNHLDEWAFDWDEAETLDIAYARLKEAMNNNDPYDVVLVDHKSLGPEEEVDSLALALARDVRTDGTNLILISPEDLEPGRRVALMSAGYFCILKSPVEKQFLFNALHANSTDPSRTGNVTRLWNVKSVVPKEKSLQILVGEDNETNQKVIRSILEYAGYQVTICNSGDDILNAVEENVFDVVVLDMHMPELDGIETAKALRFLQVGSKRLPIIMLTADATVNAIKLSEEADIDHFMTKPVETERLLEVINKLTAGSTETWPPETDKAAPGRDIVLDYKLLDTLGKLNTQPDFMKDLILGFISDTRDLAEGIKQSLSPLNFRQLQEQAHAIKGSAQNIGAITLAASAAELVKACRQQEPENLSALYAELTRVFARTSQALKQYVKDNETAIH